MNLWDCKTDIKMFKQRLTDICPQNFYPWDIYMWKFTCGQLPAAAKNDQRIIYAEKSQRVKIRNLNVPRVQILRVNIYPPKNLLLID